jgi:general secretion pathway protein F
MLSEFSYSGIDSAGKEIKGVIATSDRMDALFKLKDRGLTVVELVEKKAKEKKSFSWRKGLNDRDVYNIATELSILLRSGIRMDKAFELLMNPSLKPEFREILSRVIADIKAGKEVAQAFDRTGHFSPLFVTMIRVGEAVGNLSAAFENIAQYYRFQIQYKGEIRNALTYPLFLIVASLMTLFFVFNFIIPRFFSIFGEDLTTLPLPAKILYALSGWFNVTNLLIVTLVLLGLLLLKKYHPAGVRLPQLHPYLIKFPLIGKLIINLELSRFSYSMFSMLKSGIEFIKALKLSAALIQNPFLRGPFESFVEQIKGGKKIADVFSQGHFLPEIVPNMLRVGEGSGNLKDIFFELYQLFDERFKNSSKRALILVEPLIIVIMGLFVGFIVVSLILTVMSVGKIKL